MWGTEIPVVGAGAGSASRSKVVASADSLGNKRPFKGTGTPGTWVFWRSLLGQAGEGKKTPRWGHSGHDAAAHAHDPNGYHTVAVCRSWAATLHLQMEFKSSKIVERAILVIFPNLAVVFHPTHPPGCVNHELLRIATATPVLILQIVVASISPPRCLHP